VRVGNMMDDIIEFYFIFFDKNDDFMNKLCDTSILGFKLSSFL